MPIFNLFKIVVVKVRPLTYVVILYCSVQIYFSLFIGWIKKYFKFHSHLEIFFIENSCLPSFVPLLSVD